MFGKQKLSLTTQMSLAKLAEDCRSKSMDVDSEAINQWNGEFVLWYDDNNVSTPRLALYMDHSIPSKADGSTSGSGFGMWWTRTATGLTADEDLVTLLRS
jgi:hypothetical protein